MPNIDRLGQKESDHNDVKKKAWRSRGGFLTNHGAETRGDEPKRDHTPVAED